MTEVTGYSCSVGDLVYLKSSYDKEYKTLMTINTKYREKCEVIWQTSDGCYHSAIVAYESLIHA